MTDIQFIRMLREKIQLIYLKKYDTIISDGVHSELGEKYWIKLLEKATTDGYHSLVSINGKVNYPLAKDLGEFFPSIVKTI